MEHDTCEISGTPEETLDEIKKEFDKKNFDEKTEFVCYDCGKEFETLDEADKHMEEAEKDTYVMEFHSEIKAESKTEAEQKFRRTYNQPEIKKKESDKND